MKDSISGTVSTTVGSTGVTFSLFDPDRCILARLHFTFEEWGGVCSMSGDTPSKVQLHAPVLEKHLVRLVPAKGEILGGFPPAVVSVDGMHQHRCVDRQECVTTEEGRFAGAWKRLNSQSRTHLAYLLTPSHMDQHYPISPSDRDREVAATVIQWLGSPVGRCFLENLGYTKAST